MRSAANGKSAQTEFSPSLASPPLVELRVVCKEYMQGTEKVMAADDVDLSVTPGDFLVITGRSGSGKTTLLSLIGGLTTPTSGTVCLFGENVAELDDDTLSALRAERIGFVFQFASLIPTLTALDNVRLPGLFAERPVDVADASQLLSWVGLSDRLYSYPAQLSGGQQARVACARALANQPDLLLADEPTGNVDVETELEILQLLADLNAKRGATVVLVTHNPELARFGNRHVIMDDGRLMETDSQIRMEKLFGA